MVDVEWKAAKKKQYERAPGLRVLVWLGMVAWRPDVYEIARPYLRLLHPLSWVWLILVSIANSFLEGVPTAVDNIISDIKYETVWF